MKNEQALTARFAAMKWPGALVGLICLGVVAATYMTGNKALTAQSLLYGWIFWTMITLGCLGLTFLHHTMKATWGLSVLRKVESGGGPEALAISGILGAFVLFPNLGLLYPWANPAKVATDPILLNRTWYLNDQQFLIRYCVYFAVFIILATILRQSSRKQDETLDLDLAKKRHTLGPVGLLVFFTVNTFAITDWVMSLENHWFSSIQPLLMSVGGALSALSLCIILMLTHREFEPYTTIVTPKLTKDLGNLIFAMTMLWQYMTLSHYLLQFSANLPEEAPYWLKRNTHGWNYLSIVVITLQFFLPFTALLFPRMKKYAKNLLGVACLVFLVRFLDIYWTVLPSLRGSYHPEPNMTLGQSIMVWTDIVAVLGFGGVWFAVFGSQIGRAAVLPKHDTRLLEVEHAH